jgi:acyl-CoA synthetase (AMP-forming)/AMP-acid ligase II
MDLDINVTVSVPERLARVRARCPDHPAVVHESGTWTYDALGRRVGGIAGALVGEGIGRADRVAILLKNSPAFVEAYLAVAHAGAIPVPLDPMASDQTLEVILLDCAPAAIVCETEMASRLSAFPALPSVVAVFVAPGPSAPPRIWGLTTRPIESLSEGPGPEFDPARSVPDDIAAIVYTSGTTDVPKGVMLTHRNIGVLVATGVETLGVGRDDRIGLILPLFHLYGLRELQIVISAGATLVLSRSASLPAPLLKWFALQQVTGWPGVPGHFSLCLTRYRAQLAALGGHLRYVLMGTAPTPPALVDGLRAALPRTRIHKTYGLTECGRVTMGDVTSPEAPFNSVGSPAPGVELSLRGEDDRPVARGELGRVFIKSEMVMKGYWHRPADTAEVLSDGWFKTRDLGYLDAQGRCFLVARADQMINTGGEKTAPWEVEMVLRQHPAVENAVVVSTPDEDQILGQVPKAYVVLRSEVQIDLHELRAHCARHLEPFKVPRAIVFVPRLPETSLGKVSLHALAGLEQRTSSSDPGGGPVRGYER